MAFPKEPDKTRINLVLCCQSDLTLIGGHGELLCFLIGVFKFSVSAKNFKRLLKFPTMVSPEIQSYMSEPESDLVYENCPLEEPLKQRFHANFLCLGRLQKQSS